MVLNLKGEGGEVMIPGARDEDQQEEGCRRQVWVCPEGLRVEREEVRPLS